MFDGHRRRQHPVRPARRDRRRGRAAAAAAVGADRFIDALPDGYDTDVAKRGGRLSAGQRQLVAFARAFLADPAVLILDEATSSLDIPSERMVQRALATVLADRTALVIAHRLSTVADRRPGAGARARPHRRGRPARRADPPQRRPLRGAAPGVGANRWPDGARSVDAAPSTRGASRACRWWRSVAEPQDPDDLLPCARADRGRRSGCRMFSRAGRARPSCSGSSNHRS